MLQSSLPPGSRAGGVGYQVDLLATTLARRGHEVTVFVVDDAAGNRNYDCIRLSLRSGRFRRVLGVGRAYSQLDLAPFDVIHAHGDDWLFGRRPRIRTFYGSALMEAWSATRWLRKGSQLCYYALEWVSSRNQYSVAISIATRRYLPFVRYCVPCAFDPTVFFPGGERSLEPSILFVAGTLGGRKRGDLLVEAFEHVRQTIPTATLTIVSRDSVIGPGITCRANVGASELGALYRSHWLLCSASSYEGFGVPYVEAMASGLPIVTTPNDGAMEVLERGTLGVVSSPQDLGQNIVELIKDPVRRGDLSGRGIRAAWAYSADEVANAYERLYGLVSRVPVVRGVEGIESVSADD